MNQPTVIDYINAVGSIATPILLLALGAIGWTIRTRFEKSNEREKYLRDLEDKLRDDRINVYNSVLEPFIIILSNDEAFANDKAYRGKNKVQIGTEKLVSLEYRQSAFKLSLFGSDSVVRAYNELFQFFYTRKGMTQMSDDDTKKFVHVLGNFLLEIRRSVGNESTILDSLEMIEWLFTDARKLRA